MSKKKKQQTRSGTYALCITAGLILGIGLAPLADNILLMALVGVAGGAVAGYLINKRISNRSGRRHH